MEKFYRIKMVADKSKLSEEGITEEELFRKVENVCKNCANIIKEKENIYKSNDYHALRRFCDKLNENLELKLYLSSWLLEYPDKQVADLKKEYSGYNGIGDLTEQQNWIIVNKLTENQRRYVIPRYDSRKRSTGIAYCLWLLFGTYYFYLGKPVVNLALWLCCPLLIGFLWLLVDLFRMPQLVYEYNDKLLMQLIREAKDIME